VRGLASAFEIAKDLKTQSVEPPAVPSAVAVDPQARQVIEDLFDRLKAIYPAWKQAWPGERELNAARREWLAEFMRAGIRRIEQIQHGLRMAAQDRGAFVPAVGVFVSWCFDPGAFGLPSIEKAYGMAMRNTHPAQVADARWVHPAVYHAAVAAGFHSLQNLSRDLGFKRFERCYLEQCRRIGRGETLAAAPIAALPNPARASTPEVGRAALAALRCRLGAVTNG
jgi:hypothetical protein